MRQIWRSDCSGGQGREGRTNLGELSSDIFDRDVPGTFPNARPMFLWTNWSGGGGFDVVRLPCAERGTSVDQNLSSVAPRRCLAKVLDIRLRDSIASSALRRQGEACSSKGNAW